LSALKRRPHKFVPGTCAASAAPYNYASRGIHTERSTARHGVENSKRAAQGDIVSSLPLLYT